MSSLETGRHRLPLLAVAQAQKEITHNEALFRIDALLHPLAQDELSIPPVPEDTEIGKCWLVGASPVGGWAGQAGNLAIWAGGSWRFCVPTDGMRVRVQSSSVDRIRIGGAWVSSPTIADPSGGGVIDLQARAALVTLLNHFRGIGHITA